MFLRRKICTFFAEVLGYHWCTSALKKKIYIFSCLKLNILGDTSVKNAEFQFTSGLGVANNRFGSG